MFVERQNTDMECATSRYVYNSGSQESSPSDMNALAPVEIGLLKWILSPRKLIKYLKMYMCCLMCVWSIRSVAIATSSLNFKQPTHHLINQLAFTSHQLASQCGQPACPSHTL